MLRTTGTVTSASRLGPQDHLCWSYDDDDDFREQAMAFLADGVALGQRVAYVGDGSTDGLLTQLRHLPGADRLLSTGAAAVASLPERYGAHAVFDPDSQVADYAAATAQALADGFTGLRVVADATSLVRTASQLEAFTRYEHLIDRSMRTMPFAAMCSYDRRVLGDATVGALACLHPATREEATPFRLHAHDDADVALSGEVDVVSATSFVEALGRVAPALGGDPLVVDASGLTFIDHHGLLALEAAGRSSGAAAVVVRHAPPITGRLAEVLGLAGLTVEVRP